MKKFFTLAIIALMGAASVKAQTIIVNRTGSGVDVTESTGAIKGDNLGSYVFSSKDVKSFEVLPADTTDAVKEVAGLYLGKTDMTFGMSSAFAPTTMAGRVDSVSVTPLGGSRVQLYFSSRLEMGTGATITPYVAGTLFHVNVTENAAGDSLVFDNADNDGAKLDFVQAAMTGQPVNAQTTYYSTHCYGSISKATRQGVIRFDTAFGMMGAVHFVFTANNFEAKEN